MSEAPAPGEADPLELCGVVPPTVTAFAADESLDPAATAAHARFVVEAGAAGVFPLGTNGEFPLLSAEERERVVAAVTEEVGDEVPVLAGVGAPGTRATVGHARRAERAGADGVVVVTPYYYPLDDRAAVAHYRRVCGAVDCPVYVYHIPGRTGNRLSGAALDDVAGLDGVAGLKDSSKDVAWLGRAVDAHPGLTFLVGSDALLYPGLAVGCAGLVSAVANAFPEPVVDLYEAFAAGDRERARDLQAVVRDVRAALKRGPYMAGVKTALALREPGFEVGPLRRPLRLMDDDERAALAAELTDLGLL